MAVGAFAPETIENIAAAVHEKWMDVKQAQGFASRLAEWGEELMVPYEQLSERAKDLDRATVEVVLGAIVYAGYVLG